MGHEDRRRVQKSAAGEASSSAEVNSSRKGSCGFQGKAESATKKRRMKAVEQINDKERLTILFTLEDGAKPLSDEDKRNKVRIALSLGSCAADWFSTVFWNKYVDTKFVSM